jgi:lipopolysaccharide export system ATP-binding protein
VNTPASQPTKPLPGAQGGTLAASGLVREFGRRRVVDGVSLEVHPGEIVGLLGPNGAGKTTTFYLVVGLVAPTAGTVSLGGTDITGMRMHERARLGVGYLPQEASVFRKLSVRDNLVAVAETLGLRRTERHARVDRQLEELGLAPVARQMAYTLSGGERRRLEIARALILEPRFLLLDEPFSGVDPIRVADIQQIVRSLSARGIGTLITDHNVRETLAITDRAYLMHEGRILVEGTSERLVDDPAARRFYLGESFEL